jgi:hypothetical protein
MRLPATEEWREQFAELGVRPVVRGAAGRRRRARQRLPTEASTG